MRRKSERNKAKETPKKVEKPATRRTTRRRGKATPEASPERVNTEDNVSSTPSQNEEKDSRLQSTEQANSTEVDKGVSSSEIIKSVLADNEDDNGSVWKVARQDASPGEIQKLKLCRQRNISEASDSPLSKKKSNKWPDSGDGGTEEADSADEQIASSAKMTISEQSEDPSSSHPGQDSNEEVSDYKENLPETTSANLSDDKTNIDQQADFKETLPKTSNLSDPSCYEDNQSSSLHLDQAPESKDNAAEPSVGNLPEQLNQDLQQNASLEATDNASVIDKSSTKEDVLTKESVQSKKDAIVESVVSNENENDKEVKSDSNVDQDTSISEEKQSEVTEKSTDTDSVEEQKNTENKEEEECKVRKAKKEASPQSDSTSNTRDESDLQDNNVQSPTKEHSPKQKHDENRSTPDSDDKKEAKKNEANSSNADDDSKRSRRERRSQTKVVDIEENSINADTESNLEKEDILEINEKSDDLNVSVSTSKPAKVSLKRSFSTRLSTDSEAKKEENSVKKVVVNETNQNKENHADNDQPDQKTATKRRRWGMTITTTDNAPEFSISTDSLKALVPGAKPVSVNEVRLSKDEDDEKEHRKSKTEGSGEHKLKSDTAAKSDATKKGEAKADNHIAPRRKITVAKEAPRPKSPSPPEAQATNILLIKNLVRPFTLNQIKELLARTGTIAENGFWMDRIKSKCFVEYANEDQAFETRQALHGVSWPPSNPKKLIVEYATKEDMDAARETSKEQPATRKTEAQLSTDAWQQEPWSREERTPAGNKVTIIREWDLGKEDDLLGKEKERERKEFEKKKQARSRSPTMEAHLPAPARKFKKKEEEPPTAKLLDDLFRKTKATPCIYWLPLTNEQIIVKEEMRRQHMAEHARRLEEMRRAERNRDSRRRRSPRK